MRPGPPCTPVTMAYARRMRSVLICCTVLGACLAFPGIANAQLTFSVDSVGDTDFTSTQTPYVNLQNCADNETDFVEVIFNAPSSIATNDDIYVFLTRGDTDCLDSNNRSDDGGDPPCQPVLEGTETENNQITMDLDDLIDGGLDCGSSSQGGTEYTVYFFTAGDPANDDISNMDEYGSTVITVDVTAPPAPTPKGNSATGNLSGQSFSLSWDDDSENENIDNHNIYVDEGASGPNCACEVEPCLTAGSTPEDEEVDFTERTTAKSLSASELGLAQNENVAVFIQAVDEAGNPGPLSARVCLTAVETSGFCDLASCPNGCSLGTQPHGHAPSLFTLSLQGLVVWRRRRRRS